MNYEPRIILKDHCDQCGFDVKTTRKSNIDKKSVLVTSKCKCTWYTYSEHEPNG